MEYILDEIESCECIGMFNEEIVYDIEMADESHTFIANDILVHNTDSLYLSYKDLIDTIEGSEKLALEDKLKIILKINTEFLDKHNMLPHAIIDASPFHVSLCISNLASIRTNHIYHHCYDFGTTSLFITMGNLREVAFREKGGQIVFKRCMPIGVVMDERICSGHYFAQAFERMKQYFENPVLLEEPVTAE